MTAHNNRAANGEAAVNAMLHSDPPPTAAENLAGDSFAGGKSPADMTVAELKTLAKELGLTGCSTMNKNELLAAVSAVQG